MKYQKFDPAIEAQCEIDDPAEVRSPQRPELVMQNDDFMPLPEKLREYWNFRKYDVEF